MDWRSWQHCSLLGSERGSTAATAWFHITGMAKKKISDMEEMDNTHRPTVRGGWFPFSRRTVRNYCSALSRSFPWATVRQESGLLWAWRAATWRCSTTQSLTNISSTCTRAVSSLLSSPTVVWTHAHTMKTDYTSLQRDLAWPLMTFYVALNWMSIVLSSLQQLFIHSYLSYHVLVQGVLIALLFSLQVNGL